MCLCWVHMHSLVHMISQPPWINPLFHPSCFTLPSHHAEKCLHIWRLAHACTLSVNLHQCLCLSLLLPSALPSISLPLHITSTKLCTTMQHSNCLNHCVSPTTQISSPLEWHTNSVALGFPYGIYGVCLVTQARDGIAK